MPMVTSLGVPSVPFERTNDHIFVPARIGDTTAWMILDTGSSMSAFDVTLAGTLGIAAIGQPVRGAGTGSMDVALSRIHTLHVGDVALADFPVALVALDEVSRNSGRPVHGTLGYDFLERFTVEIDFDEDSLLLHDPKTFLAPADAVEVLVSLRYRIPVAEATVAAVGRPPVTARLCLDLGSSALAVRLGASFVASHPEALGALGGRAASIGTGVGGSIGGTIVRLASLAIGRLEIPSPAAGLATEKRGAFELGLFDGTVGTPVFARHRLWVDYPRGRMLFSPPKESVPIGDASDASGLDLAVDALPHHWFVVASVAVPSPASEAGLRAGDVVVSVDRTPAALMTLEACRRLLARAGDERQLGIRRKDAVDIVEMTLRLRQLV